MGTLLGYLLGRLRDRPDVQWAHELDEYSDELLRMIEDLRQANDALGTAVEAARAATPVLRPVDDHERRLVAELQAALAAAEDSG